MRILLIDDEPMVCELVETMLSAAGHAVVVAANGRIGLEQLETSDIDLVLTDIIMPEVEGIEMVMTIRKRFPHKTIIAMSGGGRAGDMDFLAAARELGASAILRKPFTIKALNDAISEALAAKRSS